MTDLRRRLAGLETIWQSSQPHPWRSWEQEADDAGGWFIDRRTGERAHWLDLAGGEPHGTITRVLIAADGSPTTEWHTAPGVVRVYRGLDLRLL
jgi:hypothetical protein